MAISVNNVYQKVLALANKEQRGYIPPQEFNLFADQAQKEIFEQYFYDLEQRQRAVGNEFDYVDMVNNIEERISMFEMSNQSVSIQNNEGVVDISSNISNVYRLGDVKIDYPLPQGGYMGVYYPVEQIQIKDFNLHNISSIKTFSKTRPVYTKYSTLANSIRIQIHPYPSMNSSVMINYIRKPKNPNWTYVISGGKALFSENNDFQDFELHPSEESNLVVKILQLAGVTIKDFNLVQVAGQKEVSTIQQQKQ